MENKETKGGGSQPQQPPQPNSPQRPNGKKRFSIYWIYAILAIALLAFRFFGREPATKKEDITQGDLIELLQKQEVGKIELVNKEDAEIYLNKKGMSAHFPNVETAADGTNALPSYTYKLGSLERFEEMVEDAQQDVPNDKKVYITESGFEYYAVAAAFFWSKAHRTKYLKDRIL